MWPPVNIAISPYISGYKQTPINCNLIFSAPHFPLKKGAPCGAPLIDIAFYATSEMDLISMESPSRAAVKKSKRMTLS